MYTVSRSTLTSALRHAQQNRYRLKLIRIRMKTKAMKSMLLVLISSLLFLLFLVVADGDDDDDVSAEDNNNNYY